LISMVRGLIVGIWDADVRDYSNQDSR
jgi:hypothetical protein